MANYTEQETVEYDVENAIQELRSSEYEDHSDHAKKEFKKTLRNGLNFLKLHYPDSYVLSLYISDIQ